MKALVLLSIGKLGTGFTDEQLSELTEEIKEVAYYYDESCAILDKYFINYLCLIHETSDYMKLLTHNKGKITKWRKNYEEWLMKSV